MAGNIKSAVCSIFRNLPTIAGELEHILMKTSDVICVCLANSADTFCFNSLLDNLIANF